MITHLIAAGLFAAPPSAGTGTVDAPVERTVVLTALPSAAVISTGLPIGAPAWAVHLDPADRRSFAMDWTEMLDGETIVEIVRLAVSATGASVGVEIDGSDRLPIIDTDGQKIQFWLLVDDAFQASAAFQAAGLRVAIAALIRTSSDPSEDIERSGVLTVRQQ